ncbi:hypothetical protein QP794_01960 [Paenibacillus sp. UMB7766-LJ446]|uniref:hypothetical protein n=1 Tax=Paenibacillus sp. UMB7766-LJ446 TaxID=3046313 RepID=UPI00254E5919|nr:hypothetical protein [Paenibacillus sp. UMB7766-LJ446]MDK8188848.1 hypothetical protein [Paenibacillus sp. UMB7766-LJ446]
MVAIGDQLSIPESGWKRYDDPNEVIVYTGTWSTETLAGNYNGSAKYTSTNGSTMSFTFFGTKLRIIGGLYSGRTTTAQVIIDGAVVGTINEDSATSRTKALVFDMSGLTKGKHVVQIKAMDTKVLLLDAIDVDEDGYLTRTIGTALTTPDAGWKRYDDKDSYFNITNVPVITHASAYGGTIRYISPSNNSKIKFDFQGTKIRFVASTGVSSYSPSVGVKIDGVEYDYSLAMNTSHQVMVFEKLDLEDKRHTVEIYTKDNLAFSFDAVDIGSTGGLFHPDEVTSIIDLKIGKRIRCNYVATTAGTSGAFNNIGKETSVMISTTSVPSMPSGDFYFIVTDEYNNKKILIADRPIQAAITWDALNSNGLIFGVQKDLGEKDYLFVARLLSGGYSATDTDNEWDKYIVNSTLDGNIIAGDNSVWNWSAGYSTTSTTNANSANRVRRGSLAVSTHGAIATTSAGGYRPVLEIEALPMNRSFINYEGSYKKYVPKTYIESIENAIPVMTSNTTPSGIASASSINSTSFDAYQAFNGIQDERYAWASLTPVSWLQYQFPQKKIIYKYSLSMRTNSTYYATGEPPKTWTFEGSNDGANWTILDTQSNNTTLARGVIEEYRISNSKAYTHYRVNISENQGNATITVIAELKMFEKTTVSDAGWKTISATLPSEDTFINDGMDDLSVLDRKSQGFVASMSANGSLGSGKIFKGSVDLKKYFEITSISVK